MYLQPMIPPKRFDILSPWLGDAQKVYSVRSDFSLNKCHRTMYLQPMIPPKRFDMFSPWLGDAQNV